MIEYLQTAWRSEVDEIACNLSWLVSDILRMQCLLSVHGKDIITRQMPRAADILHKGGRRIGAALMLVAKLERSPSPSAREWHRWT